MFTITNGHKYWPVLNVQFQTVGHCIPLLVALSSVVHHFICRLQLRNDCCRNTLLPWTTCSLIFCYLKSPNLMRVNLAGELSSHRQWDQHLSVVNFPTFLPHCLHFLSQNKQTTYRMFGCYLLPLGPDSLQYGHVQMWKSMDYRVMNDRIIISQNYWTKLNWSSWPNYITSNI